MSKHSIQVFFGGIAFASLLSCGSTIPYEPTVNEPLERYPNQRDQVSLLSYNVQAIFGKDESKLDALLDYVEKEKYDFVVFQEFFDEDARDYMLSRIDTNVYKSIVSRVDYDTFPEMLFQDAGLFLMSSYPQIDLSGITIDDQVTVSDGAVHMILTKELSITTDFLANKSVLGSLFQLNDSTKLFLFTTHLQAIGSKRQKRRQLTQIKNFIAYSIDAVLKSGTVQSPDNLIVLLAGDFNMDAYNEDDFAILEKELGSPRDLHREQNPLKKEYTILIESFNFYKRFDYIWAYDQLATVPLRKINILSLTTTDVKDRDQNRISDHMALKASLVFDPIITPEKIEFVTKERRAK